jgi:hypothetical protein
MCSLARAQAYALGVLLLGSAGLAFAQTSDQKAAHAIIDKALNALGGAEKQAKFRATTWKEKGTMHQAGKKIPFSGDFAMQLPDKQRIDMAFETGNNFFLVLNGDKGWTRRGGEIRELEPERLIRSKDSLYMDLVVSLTPLSDDAFALSLLDDNRTGDRPLVGVRVVHAGHSPVDLHFDRNTGLLAKSCRQLKRANKEVTQIIFYDNYLEFDGLKRPTQLRVLLDGEPNIESQYYDYRLSESLEDKVFNRP